MHVPCKVAAVVSPLVRSLRAAFMLVLLAGLGGCGAIVVSSVSG